MTNDTVARTFTRLTVVSPRDSVDVAVPDDLPVSELIRLCVTHLGEDPSRPWLLEHPLSGPLNPAHTLHATALVDAQILNLRPDTALVHGGAVDDLAEVVADHTDGAKHWQPLHARAAGSWILSGWLISLAFAAGFSPLTAVSLMSSIAALATTVVMLWCSAHLDNEMPTPPFALAVVGTAAGLGVALGGQSGRLSVIAACALGALCSWIGVALAPKSPWVRAIAWGTSVGAAVIASAHIVQQLWWDDDRALLVSVVAGLMMLASGTSLAVVTSGLASLDHIVATGDKSVTEDRAARVRNRADSHQAMMLAAATVGLGITCYQLCGFGMVSATLLAFVVCALIIVRARDYVTLWVRLVLVVPGVVTFTACTFRLHEYTNAWGTGLIVMMVIAMTAVLVMYAALTAQPVQASRLRLWSNILEIILAVSVVPLAVWFVGGFDRVMTLVAG